MHRIRTLLSTLQSQLWLIPAAFSAAAVALALWLLRIHGGDFDPWWLHSGDAASARGLLANLLSGLITMTSLVVSVTFVTLSLAANQLGPRLISIFMADRQIQSVLGIFLGTTVYVLVVLRAIDDSLGPAAVPHVAVTAGSVLTLVCLAALLYYVHKVARSIISDTVIERVAHDLNGNIRALLPEEGTADVALPVPATPYTVSVALEHSGYIQAVDYEQLTKCAEKLDAVLVVNARPGHFVLRHGDHVVVHATKPTDDPAEAIRGAFVIGDERLPTDDIEYAIRQLVEVALRALSAGVNDPFTAIAVIDRLGAALEMVLSRSMQPRLLLDKRGALRVVANRSDVDGVVGAAFDLIRQAAGGHASVLIRLADVLGMLAPTLDDGARPAVRGQLDKLAETVAAATLVPSDRAAVMVRISRSQQALSIS